MSSTRVLQRLKKQVADVSGSLLDKLNTLRTKVQRGEQLTESERWLHENTRLLKTSLREVREMVHDFRRLPEVAAGQPAMFRVQSAVVDFFSKAGFVFDEAVFTAHFRTTQEKTAWPTAELWYLKPFMQFGLLERIASGGEPAALIIALKRISEVRWLDLVEEISETEHILGTDPAGAYTAMDAESRDLYRKSIEHLAWRSKFSEQAIANEAILLAREARTSPEPDKRMAERRGHVGFYLVDRGRKALEKEDRLPSVTRRTVETVSSTVPHSRLFARD